MATGEIMNIDAYHHGRAGRPAQLGMTLIELLVVVIIIAVLAAIALPTYSGYVGRTRRVAAEGCMMQMSNSLERYYTTHMTYVDSGADSGTATALGLDCAQAAQTGNDYVYSFINSTPTASTYAIQAKPQNVQATRDAKCGTLTINQTGARTTSAGTLADCWK